MAVVIRPSVCVCVRTSNVLVRAFPSAPFLLCLCKLVDFLGKFFSGDWRTRLGRLNTPELNLSGKGSNATMRCCRDRHAAYRRLEGKNQPSKRHGEEEEEKQ